VSELLYKEEIFQLVGLLHGFAVELSRVGIPFSRERNYAVTYKGVILPHHYYADFVVWDKILFEAKAVEKLTDGRLKASDRLARQFRWRCVGMEKSYFVDNELHKERRELHELSRRFVGRG
jgi:hypothetical protein